MTTDIERKWTTLRAAEMVDADPGLSFSDAEEEAVAEWGRAMAERDARRRAAIRGAIRAVLNGAPLDESGRFKNERYEAIYRAIGDS